MEPAADIDSIVIAKINRFWRYLYIIFGLRISGDSTHIKPNRLTTCYFAVIAGLITFSNVTLLTLAFLQPHTDEIYILCLVMIMLSTWIESTLCLVILYKRQDEISHYLREILSSVDAKCRNKIWRCLLLSSISLWIILSVSSAAEIKQNETFSGRIVDVSVVHLTAEFCWWLITHLLLGSSKILFIHFCHLLKIHFESLAADVEHCAVTDEDILVYQTRFHGLVEWVNKVNSMFDPLLAVYNAGDLVLISFTMRLLLFNTDHVSAYTLPLIRELLVFFITFSYAANVQSKAEFCAMKITKVTYSKKKALSSVILSENIIDNWNYQMSIYQMSLTSVGINISGFYTISKGSILTVLATLLTYTIVLFQTSGTKLLAVNINSTLNGLDHHNF
uniref:Gustatory receptor n=1 Tax=Strigamia maritima TaxID=126957 RepID=T1JIC5_STRMM